MASTVGTDTGRNGNGSGESELSGNEPIVNRIDASGNRVGSILTIAEAFGDTESSDRDSSGGTGNPGKRRGRPPGTRNGDGKRSSRNSPDSGAGRRAGRETEAPISGLADLDEEQPRSDFPYFPTIDTPKRGPGRPPKNAPTGGFAIETGLQLLFSSIANMGYGEWWELDKPELSSLSLAVKSAWETIPKSQRAAVTVYLDKYMPWVMLLMTANSIVQPRVMATRMEMERLRKGDESISEKSGSVSNGPRTGQGGETPSGNVSNFPGNATAWANAGVDSSNSHEAYTNDSSRANPPFPSGINSTIAATFDRTDHRV